MAITFLYNWMIESIRFQVGSLCLSETDFVLLSWRQRYLIRQMSIDFTRKLRIASEEQTGMRIVIIFIAFDLWISEMNNSKNLLWRTTSFKSRSFEIAEILYFAEIFLGALRIIALIQSFLEMHIFLVRKVFE